MDGQCGNDYRLLKLAIGNQENHHVGIGQKEKVSRFDEFESALNSGEDGVRFVLSGRLQRPFEFLCANSRTEMEAITALFEPCHEIRLLENCRKNGNRRSCNAIPMSAPILPPNHMGNKKGLGLMSSKSFHQFTLFVIVR